VRGAARLQNRISRCRCLFFFTDLADLLDRLATFVDPVMLAGDLNIRLDRSDDPMSRRLCDLLESYGMNCKVNLVTQVCGDLLDIVAARDKLTSTVEVIDPGFSDLRLLRWTCSLDKPSPVYESVIRRPWRSLDVSEFKRELQRSSLCRDDPVVDDVDGLAELHESEIKTILDRLIPSRQSLGQG